MDALFRYSQKSGNSTLPLFLLIRPTIFQNLFILRALATCRTLQYGSAGN